MYLVENLFEVLVVLGAIVLLVRACRATARHGNLDEIKRMVGEGLLVPYTAARQTDRATPTKPNPGAPSGEQE